MRTKVTKWMAGISSAAMLASFSALSVPAFAAEYETMQAEAYAASFTNEKAQTVARYFLDNGVSMEETEQMMARYMNGLAMIESEQNADDGVSTTSINTGKSYYNGINSSVYKQQLSSAYGENSSPQEQLEFKQNKYYGVFLINDPMANVEATLKATWGYTNDGVTTISGVSYNFYKILNGYDNNSSFAINTNNQGVTFNTETETKNVTVPLAMCAFSFTPNSSLNSEAAIRNAFTFRQTITLLDDGNGRNSTCEFHTYVLGDFDHDGVVCDIDYSYLIDYVVMSFDGDFVYNDVGTELAFEINTLAVDVNGDGIVDLRDGIAWNNLPSSLL